MEFEPSFAMAKCPTCGAPVARPGGGPDAQFIFKKKPVRRRAAAPKFETLERTRERFEQWFKMDLFGGERDMTLKHQLWTAWQVAHLGRSG